MSNNNELISRAQAGDEQAFTELMQAYYPFVYAIVIRIVSNPHDTEEIVQDTFVNAYLGLAQYEEREKFKSWLAQIARNCARNRLRKQQVDTVPIDEVNELTTATEDLPDEQLIRNEQCQLIRRAIETLAPKDREIAHSYYLDGASYDELMQTHGLSYKAISFRLSRAKQRLTKRLRHLLTAIFVAPTTTLKQIYSGGLTVMKIGTTSKITIGAIGIIGLLFIGIYQIIILPKSEIPKDTASSVQTPANTIVQTDASEETDNRKNQPQISEKDMEQVENFFSQFEESETQVEQDVPHPPTESEQEIKPTSTDIGVSSATTKQAATTEQSVTTEPSAEDVMNTLVDALKTLDFEVVKSLLTGNAREEFERDMLDLEDDDLREIAEVLPQVEIVDSEYVGDEFHFRLRVLQDDSGEFKMRKEDGVWLVYEVGDSSD